MSFHFVIHSLVKHHTWKSMSHPLQKKVNSPFTNGLSEILTKAIADVGMQSFSMIRKRFLAKLFYCTGPLLVTV